jgi:pimeloyl-ACP methyl ester carboxylesterase
MTRRIGINRRTFLKSSGLVFVAGFAQTGMTATQRTIQTPTLDIGYEETGSASGFPVILLHGFPDDVHAYDDVAPPLANAGHRVLVPYLRGYGRTRFRDPKAPRMAEQAAIGQDLVDFADALKLPRFAVAGFDWGGRAAGVASALHPDRIRAAVFVAGYSIQDVFAAPRPSAPQVEAAFWYQWYFNTERGRTGLEQNRKALCKLLWQQWSPTWKFTDATYEQTAPSFDNPDFVDCVIHSYRHRNQGAKGDPSTPSSVNSPPARRSRCRPSCSMGRTTHWRDRLRTTRPTAPSSRSSSIAGLSLARDISCRAKNRRRCRRRCCSSCRPEGLRYPVEVAPPRTTNGWKAVDHRRRSRRQRNSSAATT